MSVRNVVEHRWSLLGGKDFFTTPYQLAAQMAIYYEDSTNIYPQFNKQISIEEANEYINQWAKKYYAPNPYTKSMQQNQKAVVINRFLVNWALEKGEEASFEGALDKMFTDTIGNTDILVNLIDKFMEVDVVNGIVTLKETAPKEKYSNDEVYPNVNINDKKAFFEYVGSVDLASSSNRIKSEWHLQKIYFGTPGSGKSWSIKKEYEMIKQGKDYVYDEEKTKRVIRTTFHPDTDYASFVGCYKPIKDEEEDEKKIVYEFVPQAFTDAYIAAWSDLEHPYYLIIEEINRGNCAQIFGDLFQLLDRNKDGYSEYPIKADHDLRDYLEEHLPNDSEGIKDGKLCLPPNLSLIASMNTSDQSLFPMDSAFKRRWSWEYVPIDYNNEKSGAFTITIDGEEHNWHEFLKAVNEKIKAVTSSEDKQMGNFFIKNNINEKEFCDKVMFYLWSEVGKDNYKTNDAIFRYYAEEDKLKEFSFNELYEQSKRTEILKGFIRYIEEEKKV